MGPAELEPPIRALHRKLPPPPYIYAVKRQKVQVIFYMLHFVPINFFYKRKLINDMLKFFVYYSK